MVPHLVAKVGEGFSICWFGKSKFFRVFHPYPHYSETPTRSDFRKPQEVVEYIKEVK